MKKFSPKTLLNCYANGIFPMSDSRDDPDVFFVDPQQRGIFNVGEMHISKSLAKTVRSRKFDIRIDTAFARIVDLCAESAPDRLETWINPTIKSWYTHLHAVGHAHSVECWLGEDLVGGLYGVSLRGGFFGESMFSRASNASKTALVHLHGRLKAGGFVLLDTQFMTDHLRRLGAIEIPRAAYHMRLSAALEVDAEFNPIGFDDSEYAKTVRPTSKT